jgi:hypothetical protein
MMGRTSGTISGTMLFISAHLLINWPYNKFAFSSRQSLPHPAHVAVTLTSS